VTLLEPVAAGSDPDPAALFLLGASLEREGRWAEAAAAFERYLAVDAPLPLRRSARNRIELLGRRAMEQAVRESIEREASLQATTPGEDVVGVFPFFYAGTAPELSPLGRAVAELLTTRENQIIKGVARCVPISWVAPSVQGAHAVYGVVNHSFATSMYPPGGRHYGKNARERRCGLDLRRDDMGAA
jgi:hypothetical protein